MEKREAFLWRQVDYSNADSDLPFFPMLLGTKNGLAGIRQYTSQMESIASGMRGDQGGKQGMEVCGM